MIDCDHNFNGAIWVCLNDGTVLKRSDFPVGTNPPLTQADRDALFDFLAGRIIVGETTSCSKCGEFAINILKHL